MKLSELRKIVERYNKPRYDDLEVVIVAQTYENGTLGHTDVTEVKCASKGIDWDTNKFLIIPEDKLRAKEFKKYNV